MVILVNSFDLKNLVVGSFSGWHSQPTGNEGEDLSSGCWILQKWGLFKEQAACRAMFGGLICVFWVFNYGLLVTIQCLFADLGIVVCQLWLAG